MTSTNPLLAAIITKADNVITECITKLEKDIQIQKDYKAWYMGKLELLEQLMPKILIGLKKVGLEITTIDTGFASPHYSTGVFTIPETLGIQLKFKMVGNRRPIKKSYNRESAKKLSNASIRITDSFAAATGGLRLNINQYSLEANDGVASQVMGSMSI